MDTVWLERDENGRYPRGEIGQEAKTPWNPTGDVVDLAKESAALRDQRRRQSGPTPAPPTGELGSAWERYRLYAYYENGNVFENGPIETVDYEDMIARDGIACALEAVLTLPIRAAKWQIKAADGDKGECEFVQKALQTPPEQGGMATPLQTVIGQMTSGRLYRRAHFEKVWTNDPTTGQAVLDKIAYRPPTTCYLARSAEDASFQGFMQWTWKGLNFIKVIIPRDRAFVYLHGTHRNPIMGTSDLQLAYNAYSAKQKLRFLWYQYLTVEAMPRLTATVPSQDQEQAKALARAAAQLRSGGVLGLTQGQVVGPIPTSNAGTAFSAAMSYLDQEMLASVLAGWLGLVMAPTAVASAGGSSMAKGSFALSKDQSQFFLDASEAVCREMASQFTHDVISSLVRYNFPSPAVPSFAFEPLAEDDSSTAAVELLQAMVAAATPTTLVPYAFIDELVEAVARALDLDVTVVAKALKAMPHTPTDTPGDAEATQASQAAQGQLPGFAGQLHGAIEGAGKLVAANVS